MLRTRVGTRGLKSGVTAISICLIEKKPVGSEDFLRLCGGHSGPLVRPIQTSSCAPGCSSVGRCVWIRIGHFTTLPSRLPLIVERHKDDEFGEREREFPAHSAGALWEFNRFTTEGRPRFENRGRTESILMSMPPMVRCIRWTPEPGSEEEKLWIFLRPRDWLGEEGNS